MEETKEVQNKTDQESQPQEIENNTETKVQEDIVEELKEKKNEDKETATKKKSSQKRKSGTAKLKDEIEELKEKNEDLRDKYLRLFADFDNYKKRVAKEKLDVINEAGKDVIVDILPILDDFDRAIKTMEESKDTNAVKEGAQLIFQKLKTMLEQKGLKVMESIGQDFDPEFHEAISEIPAPSDKEKGKVIDEVERGYYLGEKIIRYAKVVVGK